MTIGPTIPTYVHLTLVAHGSRCTPDPLLGAICFGGLQALSPAAFQIAKVPRSSHRFGYRR